MDEVAPEKKKGSKLTTKQAELRESLLGPTESEPETEESSPTDLVEPEPEGSGPKDSDKAEAAKPIMFHLGDRARAPLRDASYRYAAEASQFPIEDAAIFLHEGRMNLFLDEHPNNAKSIKLWFFIHRSWFPYFDLFMAMIYLLLALVEPPETPYFTWCPKSVIIFIQVACLSTNLVQILLRCMLVDTWQTRKLPKGAIWQIVVILILCVDLAIYVLHTDDANWHILRALRPAYILSCQKSSEVRRVVRVLFVVLYEVIDMFIFLVFYIGIWAVMATYLFGPNPQDGYFANLGDSFTQLFVLITTCNYPSVMLPAYSKNQASFLFFLIFIVIGIYFILNLILAIVFRVYTEEERNKFHKRFLRQRAAIRCAYAALMQASDSSEGVTWETFNDCMKIYDSSHTAKDRRIIFCALNTSRTGILSLEEFYHFFRLLAMNFHRSHYASEQGMRMRSNTLIAPDLVWSLEGVAQSLRARNVDGTDNFVQRLIKSPYTARIADIISDGIVLMQTIYLTILASELKSGEQSNEDQINRAILGFMIVFTIEAAIKIVFLGPRAYWLYPWHRFDTFFTIIGWIGLGCDRYTSFHLTAPVVILRAFRLSSVLTMSTRSTFTDVMTTAFTIMPRMARFGGALMCTYYVFAIIGMTTLRNTASNCPSGTFSECGAPYAFQLANASNPDKVYGFGHYQEMNFNNVWQSYVTLFTLMVVNDWNNTMGGHAVAAGTLSRAFFMCFYLFTVLIVVNVILAYVLEMFQIVVQGQEVKRRQAKSAQMAEIGRLTHGNDDSGDEAVLSTASVIKLKLTREDLEAVTEQNDRDLSRLIEMSEGSYVMYEGRPKMTQTSLYLILFQDDTQEWIDNEGPVPMLRRASVYDDDETPT